MHCIRQYFCGQGCSPKRGRVPYADHKCSLSIFPSLKVTSNAHPTVTQYKNQILRERKKRLPRFQGWKYNVNFQNGCMIIPWHGEVRSQTWYLKSGSIIIQVPFINLFLLSVNFKNQINGFIPSVEVLRDSERMCKILENILIYKRHYTMISVLYR